MAPTCHSLYFDSKQSHASHHHLQRALSEVKCCISFIFEITLLHRCSDSYSRVRQRMPSDDRYYEPAKVTEWEKGSDGFQTQAIRL